MVNPETKTIESKDAFNATLLAWKIHHWVGLKLSLFLFFVLFTGTLAVISHEIDWLAHKGMRADFTQGDNINWPDIAKSSVAAYPRAQLLSLNAPEGNGFAAYAMLLTEDKAIRLLYFNPRNGNLQGDYSNFTVQRTLRFLHRHLMLPTKYGVPIVSSLSLLLLLTFFSSLLIYKNWWRGFFRFPRAKKPRRWWGEVHRVLGAWSLWFVLLMALTGLWYLVESLGGRAPPLPQATVADDQAARSQSPDLPVHWSSREYAVALQARLELAQTTHADLRIKRVIFPQGKRHYFSFDGQYKAILVRARANSVQVSAKENSVLLVTDGRDLPVHSRISEMADPLHFGDFAGLSLKLIWFVFGLILCALSASGVVVYAQRLHKRNREQNGLQHSLSGMGKWKYLSLALILIGLLLLVYLVFIKS